MTALPRAFIFSVLIQEDIQDTNNLIFRTIYSCPFGKSWALGYVYRLNRSPLLNQPPMINNKDFTVSSATIRMKNWIDDKVLNHHVHNINSDSQNIFIFLLICLLVANTVNYQSSLTMREILQHSIATSICFVNNSSFSLMFNIKQHSVS